MHAVVFDLEVRDAAPRALATFQIDEELCAARVDIAQFVELRVEAGRNDAAIAQQRGRIGGDRAREQRVPLRIAAQMLRALLHRGCIDRCNQIRDVGQHGQRIAQPGEVARARAAQRDARHDALDVDRPAQAFRQPSHDGAVASQRIDRVVTRRSLRLVAQRLREPLAQQPAAGNRRACVEQRAQRRCRVAAERLRDLEVAPRRRIESDELAGGFDVQRADMLERCQLRGIRVREQRAGRADRQRRAFDAETVQVQRSHLLRQRARGACGIEMPRRKPLKRGLAAPRRRCRVFDEQQLGGLDPFERCCSVSAGNVGERQPSRCEVQPRNTGPRVVDDQRHEQCVALRIQQADVGQRPRRDDSRDPAFDEALASRGVADLVDDHCAFAAAEQPDQMLLERVIRNARHGNRCAAGLTACRQRDVEQPCRAFGIRVEQLVEIAHPIEQQPVRMLALEAQVLLHHRRLDNRLPSQPVRGGWIVRRVDKVCGHHAPIGRRARLRAATSGSRPAIIARM